MVTSWRRSASSTSGSRIRCPRNKCDVKLTLTFGTPNGGEFTIVLNSDLLGDAHLAGVKQSEIHAILQTAGVTLIERGTQVGGVKE